LIGTAARTAVIAGTATAVSGAVSNSAHQRAAARQAPAEQQAAPVAQQAAPAGTLTDEKIEQLQKLADLQQTGVLSEEEFANLKAQILNS
jgi:hypothetical protein